MLVLTILSLFGQYTLADHVIYARFSNTSSLSSATSSSSSSYTGTCTPICQAVQESTGFKWVKQAVTTSILAAKVILVFNKATNTTRTVTSYFPLPDGHTLPPTNHAGAHITTISVLTAAGQPKQEIVLAYPTELNVNNPEYSWQGTLPTIGPMGAPICSTVNSPNYATVTYKATLTPQFVHNTVDKDDPFGYIYSLDDPVCFGRADTTLNPNDAAPKLCEAHNVCGIHAEATALYLTETSSSVEDVPAAANKQVPTSSPNTPQPAPTLNSPAQAQATPTPVQAQNTPPPAQKNSSPNLAANIGAVLNPETQPTPVQAGATLTDVPHSTGSFNVVGSSNSAGQVAVVEGLTQQVQNLPSSQTTPVAAPILNIGGQAITANSNLAFVVAGQTVAPGTAIVVSGTTISLLPSGSGAVVNGATQTFQAAASSVSNPALILNGQTYPANSQSAFVIAGQTLSAGKTIVVSGTVIALSSTGGIAIINGVTQTIAPLVVPTVLTINGQTITAVSKSSYIISGQTLAPGHPITIGTGTSATTLSLATDSAGNLVVIGNGKTSAAATRGSHTGGGSNSTTTKSSSTSTNGVGDYIASGIGFSSVSTTQPTRSSTSTTAGAARYGFESSALVLSLLLGFALAVLQI